MFDAAGGDCYRTDSTVDSANSTRSNQLSNFDTEGKVPRPHGLHEKQVLLLCHGNELLGLRGGDGECLFAEHILTGLKCEHGVLKVVAVRSGDVNDVNVGVVDELGVGAVCLGCGRAIDFLDEAGCAVGRARRGNCYNLVTDVVDITDSRVAEKVTTESCPRVRDWVLNRAELRCRGCVYIRTFGNATGSQNSPFDSKRFLRSHGE